MSLAKTYLLAYNAVLIVGWAYVLALTAQTSLASGPRAVYAAIETPLLYAQTAAVLEIVHAALGIARSPVLVTAMQVSSRLMVVWGVLVLAPPARIASFHVAGPLEIGVPSLMFAWGITEVIRYSFYFFKLLGDVPRVITWCRYTLFIVLYPLGVSSELFLAYSGFGYLVKTNPLAYPMPNAANISFHLPSVMLMFFAGYVPGFPMLYSYMLGQRKKVLGSGSPAKGKKD
jgi:very-long-chain (3R)-3-hydroxyacyl-CoA dehydratase